MSLDHNEIEMNENYENENIYTKNIGDDYGIPEDPSAPKELLYNEEEEIVSSLGSQGSVVSIKLDEEDQKKSSGIKSEGESEEGNKDIFIDNLENIEEDRSVFGTEDKFNELLFCCQNIGRFVDENKTHYVKDEFCESNLRDIHRMLVKEDAEFPQKRFYLLKWKIVEKDVIPLLLHYSDNPRVQLLSFVILVDMTQIINDNCQHKRTINQYLTNMLSELSNNDSFFKHLGRLISTATIQLKEADSNRKELLKENINLDDKNLEKNMTDIPKEQIEKVIEIKKRIAEIENRYQQLIELIFTFLKQIFNVYNPQESWKNCEINLNFIKRMSENKIFDAINYHTTNFESEFYKRISFNFLELLHFILREFSVQQIFEITNKIQDNIKSDSLLKRLRDEEKKQQQERLSKLSTRHNNFGTSIQVKRPADNTSFMVSNITTLFRDGGIQNQTFDFQKKKPKTRYASKKYANELNDEVKFLNDLKIKENFILDPSNSHILLSLREFCNNFLEISFLRLTTYIFEEIIKQSERIEKYDIYYFFSLISFFLEFHRYMEHEKYDKERKKYALEKKKAPFFKINLSSVRELINTPLLEFAYKIVFEQSMMIRLPDRKIFQFFSSLKFIKAILMLSIDIHKINTEDSFNLNVIIQDSILSRDYIRIIKYGFNVFNPSIFPHQILHDLIEFIELYFYCLETYSKVRKLKIKEKKKRRKNRDDENEERELLKLMKEKKDNNSFIEKDSDKDSEGKAEHTGSSISFSSDDYDYKEREVDLKNEIRMVVDYDAISKILLVLKEYNNIKSTNLLRIIAKILTRVIDSDNSWIFFNIEFLNIFHILLNDSVFKSNLMYRELYDCANRIVKKFFDTFKVNKLLLVESLFRFNSAIIKDEILNNYEVKEENDNYLYVRQDLDIEKERIYGEDVNYEGDNLFFSSKNEKKDENKGKEKLNAEKEDKEKWTENEDLLLIENYLKFKEIENYMDILEGLFISKKKKDIKKRIKKLKLKKGEAKAMKRLKKLHKNDKHKEENENHNNLFNIIIDLSDKCKDENIKTNMDKTLTSLKQQLQTYNLRKDLLIDVKEDFQIIPKTEEEIEILKDYKFQNFIKNLGFVLPSKKSSSFKKEDFIINQNMIIEERTIPKENDFWKLPSNNNTEIEILIEKLDNFQKAIAENIVIPIPKKDPIKENDIRIDIRQEIKDSEVKKRKKHESSKKKEKTVQKSYIEEENTYQGLDNFFGKEPSVRETKYSVKESIMEEIIPSKRRKLKKANIDEENI